jgi:hypothetical protein
MRQVYSGVLGFLLALLVLAASACGGSSGQSADTAQKSGSSNGFTTYSVDSQGFSIAVPDSWKTASVDELLDDDAVAALKAKSPVLGNAVDQLGKPSSFVKLLAFDTNATGGFATNLNVGITQLPDDVTQKQFFDLNVAQVRQATGKPPEQEEVDLPGGHALHITWILPGLSGDPVADQYLFYTPGKGYILTYSATSDQVHEYADTFERSANSFTHG